MNSQNTRLAIWLPPIQCGTTGCRTNTKTLANGGKNRGRKMNLTKHFTLEEMIRSTTATRQGIDNTPPEYVIENLRMLCKHILEPLRVLVGEPIYVESGYRCAELNLLVNGQPDSQHKEGKAADIVIANFETPVVCQIILEHFPFDQLIEEFSEWTHVSYDVMARKETSVASKQGSKTFYQKVTRFV
jgi:zinc D-Ala-D-Ala carboxypeptidase